MCFFLISVLGGLGGLQSGRRPLLGCTPDLHQHRCDNVKFLQLLLGSWICCIAFVLRPCDVALSRTWPRLARALWPEVCWQLHLAGPSPADRQLRRSLRYPCHCLQRTTNTQRTGCETLMTVNFSITAFWCVTPCSINFSEKYSAFISNPPWRRIQHIPPNYKTTRRHFPEDRYYVRFLLIWVWNLVCHTEGGT
jgi:hypothetical protein